MEDIIFNSDSMSSRERYFFDYIQEVRDSIIKSCGKCDNGFIENKKEITDIQDIAYASAKECTCRIKANKIMKRIYSGIPRQFIHARDIKLKVDESALAQINMYIEKLDKVYLHGFGILFIPTDGRQPANLHYARQLGAIKVLLSVLDKGKTGHFIDASAYYEMQHKCIMKHDDAIEELMNEISLVDFLCINNVGSTANTDFMKNNFYSLLSQRNLNCKPTMYTTSLGIEKLNEYLGPEIMEMMVPNVFVIHITKYDGRAETFPNLKKEIGD